MRDPAEGPELRPQDGLGALRAQIPKKSVDNPHPRRPPAMLGAMTTSIPASPGPRVLTCHGPADLIAALPRLTGFVARDSVFVLLYAGDRARTALRVDLPGDPDPDSPVADRLLDFIGEAAVRGPRDRRGRPYSSAIVITTSLAFRECGGPPLRGLAVRIERRLRRDGLAPRELCCLAADGWASYLDPSPPLSGHPLALVHGSPVAEPGPEPQAGASGVGPSTGVREPWPELERLGEIVEADPSTRAAVADELAALEGAEEVGEVVPLIARAAPIRPRSERVDRRLAEWIAEVAGLADELCAAPAPAAAGDPPSPAGARPETVARLARCARSTDGWFVLAVAFLTRAGTPERFARDARPASADDPAVLTELGRALLGVLERARPGPEHLARVTRARTALTAAIGAVPTAYRADLLALCAWLWWLGGLQSVAHRQLALACALGPNCTSVRVAERLITAPFSEERLRAC